MKSTSLLHDSNGKSLGFTYGSYEYYFRYNLQGDVTGLINAATGNIDAFYEYDSHGNVLSRVAVSSITSNICRRNVFLYRGAYGYFYDSTSGLYYLQTRFYDPVIGRFLNADDTDFLNASGTTLGCNLYAYCENDGVNAVDPTGYYRFKIKAWVVAAVLDSLFILMYRAMVAGYISLSVTIWALSKSWYTLSYARILFGTITKVFVRGIISPVLTLIRSAIWRITGVALNFLTGYLIDTGLNYFLNNLSALASCILSWGGLIAGIMDWISDKKLDGVILV